MNEEHNSLNVTAGNTNQVLFISSYPPRECGIATFTQDLIHALKRMFDYSFEIVVCALQEDDHVSRIYPAEVIAELNPTNPSQLYLMADFINNDSRIISVVIEHEFGLYGGAYGENIFHLLDSLIKPVFICLHTVLSDPFIHTKEVVCKLAEKAEKIIVLTRHSSQVLERDYQINRDKIVVIPHGVHIVKPFSNRTELKSKFGFADKIILGTFGLINSNKGIECALHAIAKLPDKKNILYLIMGKTHPVVLRNEGEKYRNYLMKLTRELGIEEQVLFINKYMELKELLTYLRLTDIYLFTSKDPLQTVSGTLSYAMGSGCTVISTPIPHAREMLNDGAGFIFDFDDSSKLKEIILELIADQDKLKTTSIKAIRKAKCNSWENIAIQFALLFRDHINEQIPLMFKYPPLQLNHFCKLTTAFGMLQFSNMSEPDLSSGFTTDDNARALYVLTLFNELFPNDPSINNYFRIYLNFLENVQTTNGSFINYVNINGEFSVQNKQENLEEANARAFVAICRFLYSNDIADELKTKAYIILKMSLPYIITITSPRPVAKLIKGLYFLYQYKKDAFYLSYIYKFSADLLKIYAQTADDNWEWYESYLTYNNSSLPEGLMYAYLATNNAICKSVALKTFEFLLDKIIVENKIRVISNRGWLKKGDSYEHKYGEQPVEIASAIEALYIFYQATGEKRYKDLMYTTFSWFLGNNHLHQMVYDPVTGGCQDGIEEFEVNINQGAESTLSYTVSRLIMYKLAEDEILISELFSFRENKSQYN